MREQGGGAFSFGARDTDDLISERPQENIGLRTEVRQAVHFGKILERDAGSLQYKTRGGGTRGEGVEIFLSRYIFHLGVVGEKRIARYGGVRVHQHEMLLRKQLAKQAVGAFALAPQAHDGDVSFHVKERKHLLAERFGKRILNQPAGGLPLAYHVDALPQSRFEFGKKIMFGGKFVRKFFGLQGAALRQ